MKIEDSFKILDSIHQQSSGVILNGDMPIKLLLVSLVSSSHVILQGAPGTGKTLLVENISNLFSLRRKCIHCTSESRATDLADTLLTDLSESQKSTCEFLSIDEINRATPGFQAALLELMEEGVFRQNHSSYSVAQPFSVVATKSSMESADTFPLPEAQLDRFGLVISMQAPSAEQLLSVLSAPVSSQKAEPLCTAQDLFEIQKNAEQIHLSEKNARIIAEVIVGTSPESSGAPDIVKRYVKHGAGVRAAQTLSRATRALALIEGRTEVSLDDIRYLLAPVIAHRLSLNFAGFANAIAPQSILEAIKHRFL